MIKIIEYTATNVIIISKLIVFYNVVYELCCEKINSNKLNSLEFIYDK